MRSQAMPRVSIIYNNGGDFPMCGKSPLLYLEITSAVLEVISRI